MVEVTELLGVLELWVLEFRNEGSGLSFLGFAGPRLHGCNP